jgi:hypothetical protein
MLHSLQEIQNGFEGLFCKGNAINHVFEIINIIFKAPRIWALAAEKLAYIKMKGQIRCRPL